MADGCLSNIVKYLLFITNFLIFALAVAVLGCGIWVLVDKPNFLNLFEKAEEAVPDLDGKLDISLYTSAAYIIIVIAVLVAIVSFFGCFGALKESKCMLGTYFVLILALFIVMIVGAVLGYTGDIEESLKGPLNEALTHYKDTATQADDPTGFAYKQAWNEVQSELKCCAVDNVDDWKRNTNGWESNSPEFNKPEGCCQWMNTTEGWVDISTNTQAVKDCRSSAMTLPSTKYAFEGCYTSFVSTITDNQQIVVGVAIGVVVVMFLNMLFSFAMCTMVN